MKYHFCLRFFATWANQQPYKTSPYDMGWRFGGSVGIKQFIWQIVRQKQYSQFPLVYDFEKPWRGVAFVPCETNPGALYAWVILWHATGMLSLAEHWYGRRALSNHAKRFVCSTLRELEVSNLGQRLFCLSITWSRCRNAYWDLWIMTIEIRVKQHVD